MHIHIFCFPFHVWRFPISPQLEAVGMWFILFVMKNIENTLDREERQHWCTERRKAALIGSMSLIINCEWCWPMGSEHDLVPTYPSALGFSLQPGQIWRNVQFIERPTLVWKTSAHMLSFQVKVHRNKKVALKLRHSSFHSQDRILLARSWQETEMLVSAQERRQWTDL